MLRQALALSVLLFCALPAPGQSDGGAAAMVATERYLFVRRGDEVFQFEVHTLRLLRTVRLPAAAAVGDQAALEPPVDEAKPDRGAVEGGVAEDRAEPGRVPAEPKPEPAAQWRAPGSARYAERAAGNRQLAERDGKASATAIQLGLDWLARHQADDGRWDADAFMEREQAGARSDGPGLAVHDVGVTGLALLAFLADGNTLRAGRYQDQVKRAVIWLRGQQDPATGLIGTASHTSFVYDHAIATLAIVEAYGLSEYRVLRQSAQLAIDYLEAHRNPYAVWRYQPRDGDNDTSVTTWCVMAYRAAQDFGLPINERALQLAGHWLEQMTDPVTGRTGYTDRGGQSSRLAGQHAQLYPREANEAMTAAALCCRLVIGQKPAERPMLERQADLVAAAPPNWAEGRVDEYAWMLGSLALREIGGERWQDWSRRLEAAVVPAQRQDGNFAGSWDPVGVWGQVGGRVFSTAMLCLALQAPYRYARQGG